MNIQQLFALGMKRDLPQLFAPISLTEKAPVVLNFGAGNSPIVGTISLDYPSWNAETDPLPFGDGEVDGIYAFHFFEHFSGAAAIRILREVQRVLRVGGVLTVAIPHRLGSMAYQDLDHKSFWTEDSWRVLFANPYYDKNREEAWKLDIHFNAIVGVAERNLALFSQLVRKE